MDGGGPRRAAPRAPAALEPLRVRRHDAGGKPPVGALPAADLDPARCCRSGTPGAFWRSPAGPRRARCIRRGAPGPGRVGRRDGVRGRDDARGPDDRMAPMAGGHGDRAVPVARRGHDLARPIARAAVGCRHRDRERPHRARRPPGVGARGRVGGCGRPPRAPGRRPPRAAPGPDPRGADLGRGPRPGARRRRGRAAPVLGSLPAERHPRRGLHVRARPARPGAVRPRATSCPDCSGTASLSCTARRTSPPWRCGSGCPPSCSASSGSGGPGGRRRPGRCWPSARCPSWPCSRSPR